LAAGGISNTQNMAKMNITVTNVEKKEWWGNSLLTDFNQQSHW